MKCLVTIACFLILGGSTFANPIDNIKGNRVMSGQNSGRPLTFTDAKSFKSSICSSAALDSSALNGVYILDEKNVNARALRDFQVRFDKTSEVIWYSDENGFTSYFTKDGFRNRAHYSKKGRWQYSLIYYGQEKLPQNVRTKVKSSYADLDIDIVVEMQSNYGMAYVVYMGNKSNIRILKVNEEGEMETMIKMVRG